MRDAILLTHTPAMRRAYYGEDAVAALGALGSLRLHHEAEPLDTRGLVEAAAGVRLVVADRMTPCEAPIFDALPDLVAVLRVAVDTRNIDVAAASAAGVLVTRAGPGFVDSVAELVIGYMVDLARGITDATLAFRAGCTPVAATGRQLSASTLGIIGYGSIGRRLAKLAQAFDMTILVTDPHVALGDAYARQVGLAELLASSDFVACLAPATPDTENMIDAEALGRMRKDAFLINASRGNLVDEAALGRALQERRIAGAALDVGRAPDQMPTPDLAARAEVIATPHVGGLTPQAVAAQALETVAQAEAVLRGRVPPGAINAADWTRLRLLRG